MKALKYASSILVGRNPHYPPHDLDPVCQTGGVTEPLAVSLSASKGIFTSELCCPSARRVMLRS